MNEDVAVRSRHVSIGQIADGLDEPVVVIDVLRAFTTAPWVFEGGASALVLARSTTDALSVKSELGASAVAITDAELAPGFDLGNSPAQARRFDLVGRPVVQTTANGTVGVHAARHAPLVLCAGLVTASATAQALVDSGSDRVTYVITGDGGTADEDVACAELIHALVTRTRPPGDTIERVHHSRAAEGLRRGIASGFAGVDEADIHLACDIDRFDFALAVSHREGHLELLPTSGRGARAVPPSSAGLRERWPAGLGRWPSYTGKVVAWHPVERVPVPGQSRQTSGLGVRPRPPSNARGRTPPGHRGTPAGYGLRQVRGP